MVQVAVAALDPLQLETPMLAPIVFEDQPLVEQLGPLDRALGGLLSRLREQREISGKPNTVTLVHTAAAGPAPRAERVAVGGAGRRERFDLEGVRVAAAAAARKAQELRLPRFALAAPGLLASGLDAAEVGQAVAEGVVLALYRYDRFKSVHEDGPPPQVERASVVHPDPAAAALRAGAAAGERLAAAVIVARDLATGPANLVTATYLGERASELARQHGFSAQVFDHLTNCRSGWRRRAGRSQTKRPRAPGCSGHTAHSCAADSSSAASAGPHCTCTGHQRSTAATCSFAAATCRLRHAGPCSRSGSSAT